LSAIHMVCNMVGAWATMYASQLSSSLLTRNKHETGTSLWSTLRYSLWRPSSSSSAGSGGSSTAAATLADSMTIPRKVLDAAGRRRILAFSVLFSLNIAIGNVSLQHVSVNFNQVMRSLVPAITILLAYGVGKPVSRQKWQAVVPIVVGVAMSCFGDMSFTATGFLVTVGCIVLAALKVVASGELLTGATLSLHPVDLLSHMAPLALVQCLGAAFAVGEVARIRARWSTELSPWANPYPLLVVACSGLLSFSLNLCSLQANKVTSPLTLCIAANVKQVLMSKCVSRASWTVAKPYIGVSALQCLIFCLVLCFAVATSTLLFGTVISPLNGAGILVVLVASAWYSYISVVEENASKLARHRVLKAAESDLDDVEIGGDDRGNLGDTETDALLDSSSRSGKSATMVHRK
jgi:Triose-phosphate Transporter family